MRRNIGDIVNWGAGKCSLRICGYDAKGNYLAKKLPAPLKETALLKHFAPELLRKGAILRLPNGRTVELTEHMDASDGMEAYWRITYPDDIIAISEEEIERTNAEMHVAIGFGSVATRVESHTRRGPGFAPRRTSRR